MLQAIAYYLKINLLLYILWICHLSYETMKIGYGFVITTSNSIVSPFKKRKQEAATQNCAACFPFLQISTVIYYTVLIIQHRNSKKIAYIRIFYCKSMGIITQFYGKVYRKFSAENISYKPLGNKQLSTPKQVGNTSFYTRCTLRNFTQKSPVRSVTTNRTKVCAVGVDFEVDIPLIIRKGLKEKLHTTVITHSIVFVLTYCPKIFFVCVHQNTYTLRTSQ